MAQVVGTIHSYYVPFSPGIQNVIIIIGRDGSSLDRSKMYYASSISTYTVSCGGITEQNHLGNCV